MRDLSGHIDTAGIGCQNRIVLIVGRGNSRINGDRCRGIRVRRLRIDGQLGADVWLSLRLLHNLIAIVVVCWNAIL